MVMVRVFIICVFLVVMTGCEEKRNTFGGKAEDTGDFKFEPKTSAEEERKQWTVQERQ